MSSRLPAEAMHMEKNYWIGRKRAAMAMARGAASPEARLIHYEMAGRYSIKAAHAFVPSAGQSEGEPLRLPIAEPLRPPHGDDR